MVSCVNLNDWVFEMYRRKSAMWSKTDTDLADIAKICQLKWRAPSSGCQEAWNDFRWQRVHEFSRNGNIPIVMALDLEIMLDDLSR